MSRAANRRGASIRVKGEKISRPDPHHAASDQEQTSKAERVERDVARDLATKPWAAYLEASLGFRNHWYPAFFSYELAESECKAAELLGERLIFRRAGGTVYALEDRCMHRGVPLSAKPECYTETTITCWYHGSTFRWRDGLLVAVLTDPQSPLIGKVRIRSYPVHERQGLVFVFIGDLDPPPPLVEDMQPELLDADLHLSRGWRQLVKSNWRLGAENGKDPGHLYLHRNSPLITALRALVPLSVIRYSSQGMSVVQEGGPKGVVYGEGGSAVIWEAEIEGVKVSSQFRPGETGTSRVNSDVSIWLPCGLKVTNFPLPGTLWFEWYVPIDEHSHDYMLVWGRKGVSAAEAERFDREVDSYWKDLIGKTFVNEDVMAREGMERFYSEEGGWYEERLLRPDLANTQWRKLASTHNRGIQRRR